MSTVLLCQLALLLYQRDAYNRLHRGTIAILPARGDRPVPNLEHTILHVWTLVTALVTAKAYFHP